MRCMDSLVPRHRLSLLCISFWSNDILPSLCRRQCVCVTVRTAARVFSQRSGFAKSLRTSRIFIGSRACVRSRGRAHDSEPVFALWPPLTSNIRPRCDRLRSGTLPRIPLARVPRRGSRKMSSMQQQHWNIVSDLLHVRSWMSNRGAHGSSRSKSHSTDYLP